MSEIPQSSAETLSGEHRQPNSGRNKSAGPYQRMGVLLLLFFGYGAYYLCRAYFVVLKPLLLEEYELLQLDLQAIGLLTSIGTLTYGVGKLIGSGITDFVGGKLVFVLGMVVSALTSIIFGLANTFLAFALAWGLNRLVQSFGWGAVVKLAAQWFSYRQYGRVMAFLSLSFLLGDAFWRYSLGLWIAEGAGWREVVLGASAGLALVAWLTWLLLKNEPDFRTEDSGQIHPRNLFGPRGWEAVPHSFGELYRTFFSSRSFGLLVLVSLGITLIRESTNEWLNTYLAQAQGVDPGLAAQYSALFPLVGAGSVLLAGFVSDSVWRGRRAWILLGAQLILSIGFAWFYWVHDTALLTHALWAVVFVAFFLLGPYTFVAGAMAMDLGGRAGSAAASSLLDAVGYLASVVAGYGLALIVQQFSWPVVFLVLSGVALLTALAALGYLMQFENRIPFPGSGSRPAPPNAD